MCACFSWGSEDCGYNSRLIKLARHTLVFISLYQIYWCTAQYYDIYIFISLYQIHWCTAQYYAIYILHVSWMAFYHFHYIEFMNVYMHTYIPTYIPVFGWLRFCNSTREYVWIEKKTSCYPVLSWRLNVLLKSISACRTWWRHQMETYSTLLAICAGNSPVPVNSPHKGQWRGALMFSLICVWINGWVNNREAGD